MTAFKWPAQLYQMAVGWNNASALLSVEQFPATGLKPWSPVDGYSTYNPGKRVIRLDGQIYLSGYPSCDWPFSYWTREHYQYLLSTFSTGGSSYSGKVTIKTRVSSGAFANYNAIMQLPFLPELARKRTLYITPVLRFTRLVAI